MATSKNTGGAKKIAVILNGCGHRDGTEIHEAVLTLLAIEQQGASWEAVALDKTQSSVLNHLDGSVDRDSSARNMLRESARIARGRIKSFEDVSLNDFDAVIIPGGNGTASNLCDFAVSGRNMSVNPKVRDFLTEAHRLKKPIGGICIAPILLASVFGKLGVRITLGERNSPAAEAAQAMGASVVHCSPDQCVIDEKLRVVTTPAYMCDTSIANIHSGINALVKAVVAMTF